MTLGTLLIELRANTDSFIKGIGQAKQYTFDSVGGIVASLGDIGKSLDKLKFDNAKNIGASLTSLAAVGVGTTAALGAATAALVETSIQSASAMHELSAATGVGVETLSGFNLVAKTTGVDAEQMARALAARGGN